MLVFKYLLDKTKTENTTFPKVDGKNKNAFEAFVKELEFDLDYAVQEGNIFQLLAFNPNIHSKSGDVPQDKLMSKKVIDIRLN